MARMYAEAMRRHLDGLPTILNRFQYDYDETGEAERSVRMATGRCSYSFADTYDFPTVSLPKVDQGGVAIYVRSTTTSEAYDQYEVKLVEYCQQQGWLEIHLYQDRVNPNSFLAGWRSESALDSLMSDIASGKFRAVVIHDLGQLAKTRYDAWVALAGMMENAEVHVPGLGKVDTESQIPGSSDDNLWPRTYWL